jgi:hypothetical protein
MIVFSANIAFASSHCSATYDTGADPALLQFIKDLNPFWGTWRGTYNGESVVGEFYIDKEARFNIKGNYKTTALNDRKIRLCYRDGKFQAIVSGITLNIEVINSRTLRVTSFLINGAITVQR